MDIAPPIINERQYRLALLCPRTHTVLATVERNTHKLPRLSIPKWTRSAEAITVAVKEKWKLSVVVIDFLTTEEMRPPCAILEVRRGLSEKLAHTTCGALDEDEVTSAEEKAMESLLTGVCLHRDPFNRLGWLDEAEEWIRASVTDRKVAFTHNIRQLNAGGAFALLCLGVHDGPAYWLKATGNPNLHEGSVTTTLAHHFPQYLPPLIAYRADWNAWVTQDAGVSLYDLPVPERFEQAIRAMANLQIESISHVETLRFCGCADQRLNVLADRVPDLIAYLEDAMTRQVSTKVLPLEAGRLREIGQILSDACAKMASLCIPDTLIHNDINPGNILFDGSRCVFIDWAEACVGNPFFTFQQLRLLAAHEINDQGLVKSLDAIYRRQWRNHLTESQLHQALALTPLLTIASCLLGRGTWLFSDRSRLETSQGYARSLARHMDRAARAKTTLEALCH